MEALGPALGALIKQGGPWLVMAIFVILFWFERKRKDELADRLYELGMASVKRDTQIHTALVEVRRDLDEIRRS
jgi:hypothetical protein